MEQTELEVLGRHPPQQNVLPIGEIAIKRDIYFFSYFALLLSPCPSSQLFLCSENPAYLEFVFPALWYLPDPIPHSISPNTHIVTDRPWVLRKQGKEKMSSLSAALGEVTETGEGSAVLYCKDCQENKREKILNVSISPTSFFFKICK